MNSTPASAPITPVASVASASAAASQPANANTPANNGAPLVLDMSNIPDPDDFDDGAVW